MCHFKSWHGRTPQMPLAGYSTFTQNTTQMDSIPSGYQIHITSWENDGDNYKTKIISGLTKEDVHFYLCFLNYFKSYEYGNGDIFKYPSAEKIAITNAYRKCRPTSPQLIEDVENSIEHWKTSDYSCDWVYKTIGTWDGGNRYRVFDYCEVYLIRTPIPNVTEDFVDGY
jgi:hypothetical protein